jgi:hypothetical protein
VAVAEEERFHHEDFVVALTNRTEADRLPPRLLKTNDAIRQNAIAHTIRVSHHLHRCGLLSNGK